MRVLTHSVRGFRNLRELEFAPAEGVNLICGRNGEGKTNLAESLWLLTGCQSFRTKRLKEMLSQSAGIAASSERGREHSEEINLSARASSGVARIDARIFAAEREQTIRVEIDSKRQAQLNGVALPSPHALLGSFPAVLFSPDTLALVREGAQHRRRFLDIAISLQRPAYAAALSKYCKALAQRNALLRTARAGADTLEPWDFQLARHGARLVRERGAYAEKLSVLCAEIYAKLSGGAEKLTLEYAPCVTGDSDIAEGILALLRRTAEQDSRWQYTTTGVHKEDFVLRLEGREARTYGSRGQIRCCALSLKIAEATLLRDCLEEAPIVILDDVMSELDGGRQAALLEYLRPWQAFVTCCELPAVFAGTGAAIFHMSGGELAAG